MGVRREFGLGVQVGRVSVVEYPYPHFLTYAGGPISGKNEEAPSLCQGYRIKARSFRPMPTLSIAGGLPPARRSCLSG